MEIQNSQLLLFNYIKGLMQPHISFVDEVAEVLQISNDSAYRRIRGEKPITLEETKLLCLKYKISIDELLHLNSDAFIFRGNLTNNSDFIYGNWLESCLEVIKRVKTYETHHMYYLAKEFPFFYYFLMPEIASFKSFFFMKSILFYDEWKTAKFSVKDDYSQYHKIWKELSSTFATIPGTEIWNVENVTSTIRQIEFYNATGVFKSVDDMHCLFDKLLELIDHIELQAENGLKLSFHQNPSESSGASYNIYINELIMGDNMQIVQLNDKSYTYINHSILNFMMTTSEKFNSYMKKTLEVIAQKSTPISKVNEKERLIFFNSLRTKVKNARKKIFV